MKKKFDLDDKDLAIVAVVFVAVGYCIAGAITGTLNEAFPLARDCVLVLGSVATGKALSK